MPTKREAQHTAAPEAKRLRDNDATDCSSARALHSSADDYECSICLSLLVEPVVGHCGHDFCRSCFEEWRDRTDSGGKAGVSCPVCRQVAMAPGVRTLGVCMRLQRLIEQQFPEELQERRAEVAASMAELHASRQKEAQQQAAVTAAVRHVMHARFNWAAQIMASRPDSQPSTTSRRAVVNIPPVSSATITAYTNLPSAFHALNSNLSSPFLPTPAQASEPASWTCAQGNHTARADSLHGTASASAPSWQNPAQDAELRQSTVHTLVQIFVARRPNMSESFRQRLPNLVRKLEDVLYRSARSRDEYADQRMLQARVQAVARHLTQQHVSMRPEPSAVAGVTAAASEMPAAWEPLMPVAAAAQFLHAS